MASLGLFSTVLMKFGSIGGRLGVIWYNLKRVWIYEEHPLYVAVTGEVGAGGPKVLGWRIDRYWVLDDGFRDTRGDGGQVAREDVLLPETESDRIQKVA
jgi:hypothetical protein